MQINSNQHSIPVKTNNTYDISPTHLINDGKIEMGYSTLADHLIKEKNIILDGYVGIDWNEVISSLIPLLKGKGLKVSVYDIQECLKSQDELESLVNPYLGGDNPIFGYRTNIALCDYFDNEKIANISIDQNSDINLIYGTGASQSKIQGFLVYFDLPKNELQYRMRAGTVTNLGFVKKNITQQMYKHFYFVDWVVLNEEKKKLLPQIAIIVDQQKPNDPTWMTGYILRNNLRKLSKSCFRVRPWFETGVWGGQWMKERFSGLDPNAQNYAWSFEMIVPENGLVFERDGILLEVSFDMLMFQEQENVLGKAVNRFGDEFPIRFDFLDTFQGGNLSLQVHPKPDYIKKEFGENFTQDETYYILDSEDKAEVYLGFQEGIDASEFKEALEQSYSNNEKLDVQKFVQKFPSKKHDLFLIPHGTIHCSGENNMVLEISATPYIFTFKMYDWLRLDLDGKARPLNIERAFSNLNFERQGEVVQQTLLSKPFVESFGENWKKIHLPTHQDHFYDIYRYEFTDEVFVETLDQCHILMLVQGSAVELNLIDDSRTFHYAETFAVPAATGSYTLRNKGNGTAFVIVSFVKDEAC